MPDATLVTTTTRPITAVTYTASGQRSFSPPSTASWPPAQCTEQAHLDMVFQQRELENVLSDLLRLGTLKRSVQNESARRRGLRCVARSTDMLSRVRRP